MKKFLAIAMVAVGMVMATVATGWAQTAGDGSAVPAEVAQAVVVPVDQAVVTPADTIDPVAAVADAAAAVVVPEAEGQAAPEAEAQAVPEVEGQAAPEAEAPVTSETEPTAVLDFNMSQAGNVTVDFRDADIRNVLKVLAYKSGVNIIPGPDVVGLVNIQLKDVPWQKALDVILTTYGYGYEQKGSIIMVTTIDLLKKRREDAKLLADQEPVSTETFVLRFAKAEEVKESVDKMKTARGSVNFDKRTNALIVSDVISNLQLISEVVKSLDTITPQVLIEAKIVETSLTNDENLGIDWTVQGTMTGSTRSTSFPWDGTTQVNKFIPAATPVAGPLFTYGTLNLSQFSAVLKMLKDRTNTDIVSNPRIVTMDNQPAKITVGKQYPVPQYTFNEEQAKLQVSGWNYLDIGVIFNVTPHVNSTGLVTLDIEPSITDIVDYAIVENTSMPILTSESAKTNVMIKDGDTLVIAGLIRNKNVDGLKKVPIIGDIPFLGIPFQKKTSVVNKLELLIFLTPHIITPEVEPKAVVPPVK